MLHKAGDRVCVCGVVKVPVGIIIVYVEFSVPMFFFFFF